MMESCGFVMPSRIVGFYNSSGMSTTAMEPGFFGDTYGSSKFFSSSVTSTSGDGGRTGSTLWDLGIFATGLEEIGGSAFKGCTMTKTWAFAGCTSGREAVIYVR